MAQCCADSASAARISHHGAPMANSWAQRYTFVDLFQDKEMSMLLQNSALPVTTR